MYRIIFTGKEDYAFIRTVDVQDEDELYEAIEEFEDYVMIRNIKPSAFGENFMSWKLEKRNYHLFWSKIFER